MGRSNAVMYGGPPPPRAPRDLSDVFNTNPEDMGRGELLELVARLTKERDAYLENLTNVQTRCTELLEEKRAIARQAISALFPNVTLDILVRVGAERARQEDLCKAGKFAATCASKAMTHTRRLSVLTEEVGEVARALNDAEDSVEMSGAETKHLVEELVQVAAVAVAWVESQS